tara:strand:- start:1134 stop:1625 length:492 start_codon:yes stop_codon:yes gene_type:complete
MSSYRGIENDSTRNAFRMSLAPDPDKFKSSSFLDAIGKNPEAVGTFAQMLSAAGTGRDRGYNQSGGFGGYGGSSRMSGSGQFMSDLGGTPGYSSSSLFMPDGQGGWSGGVGGYGGKRTTGQKLAAGAGGALTGALAGAKAGSALGPHGALIGGGLGFLSGFLG